MRRPAFALLVTGVLAHGLATLALKPASASVLPLQQAAERALGGRPGCVVAMDAETGTLRVLVNPNVAATLEVPIGSLAKLVTGMAALDAGLTDGSRKIRCKGAFERWTCWKVHGEQTVEEAIANSCSTYFFTVGRELGAQRLNQAFEAAGFGRLTQSGLAGERPGTFTPARTLPELTELSYGDTPALLATPLQVASWVGAIANGGIRYAPHFEHTEPVILGRLTGLRGLASVKAGMRLAVLSGSAEKADLPMVSLYGKTGTSTHVGAPNRRHGWFVGFAERKVVVVFIKDGNGYNAAAPVAKEVFAAWL